MRRKVYSEHANHIVWLADKLQVRIWSDPDWATVEAGEIETPTGEVHLHWMNHRGRGHWNIVTHAGSLCKTVRCRVVTITPHGGENESVPIDKQRYEKTQDNYWNNKRLDKTIAYDARTTPQRKSQSKET